MKAVSTARVFRSPCVPWYQFLKLNPTTATAQCMRYQLRTIRTTPNPDISKDPGQAQQLYDLSLGLSRTPVNRNVNMLYTLYNANGTVEHSRKKISKLEIANKYGLSARDLRTIDIASPNGISHILIRESAMLIYMFNLRLLVQADQVLLFHLDGSPGAGGADYERNNNTARVFCHDLEAKLHRDCAVKDLPYELRVLEAALASVTSTLEAEYLLGKQQVSNVLKTLDEEESLSHSDPRRLLDLVRTLAGIEQRARHVRSAIQDILNDDQDMADMYLSDKKAGKPHAVQDHQDVEYLLEAYYKASDTVVNDAASLVGNIQQTEDTIRSILDVRRNQIMVLEAKIEIVMLGLGAATLVAGLYGMNVINYSEESRWAFGVLVALCLGGTGLISRYGMRQLRKIQKVHL